MGLLYYRDWLTCSKGLGSAFTIWRASRAELIGTQFQALERRILLPAQVQQTHSQSTEDTTQMSWLEKSGREQILSPFCSNQVLHGLLELT